MSRYGGAVLRHLHGVFDHGSIAGYSEQALLDRFVSQSDELAFAALVARHGPMVLGVCRRILHNEHDVEDAFQATFLVLVRRAAGIRQGHLIGHWLHVVAYKVAVRARARAARRHRLESAALDPKDLIANSTSAAIEQWDLREILDEELASLPSSLRKPLVLCYLQGLTHDEAALRLRWPVGTVRSRMSRARDLLRRRLTRRGFPLEAGVLSTMLTQPPIPDGVVDSTAKVSLRFLSGRAASGGTVSSASAALAKGVIHAMLISKIKMLAAATIVSLVAVSGVPSLARQRGGDARETARPARPLPAQDDTRSYSRIERVLTDLETQNRNVQSGLDALRHEIRTLRDSEALNLPGHIKMPLDSTSACPAQMIGNCISCHGTGREAPSTRLGSSEPALPTAVWMDGLSGNPAVRRDSTGDASPPKTSATLVNRKNEAMSYADLEHVIFVTSREGDRVAVYQKSTGQSAALRLPGLQGSRHDVGFKFHGWTLALSIKGPHITQLAVFENVSGPGQGWYVQDLREPVDEAVPTQIDGVTFYCLGSYVYAFSDAVRRWDVLELPKGQTARPVVDLQKKAIIVRNAEHLYMFNTARGKWDDINLSEILNGRLGEPTQPITPGLDKP
jgi:RNA polymerase sigma factor (sigma-70 family)